MRDWKPPLKITTPCWPMTPLDRPLQRHVLPTSTGSRPYWKVDYQQFQVYLLEAFEDNYIFIFHEAQQNHWGVVDPGDASPVIDFFQHFQTKPQSLLLTHHHYDHIDGVSSLVQRYSCKVIGSQYDIHRLPSLTQSLVHGQEILVGAQKVKVFHTPGHTTGHIIYDFYDIPLLFCGDTLFLMGCGRLFEGTFEQLYQSLQVIKKMDPETDLYCTHEYTLNNAEFSRNLLPDHVEIQKRYQSLLNWENQPTIPGRLSEELITNPFLLAKSPEEFTNYRKLRNQW